MSAILSRVQCVKHIEAPVHNICLSKIKKFIFVTNEYFYVFIKILSTYFIICLHVYMMICLDIFKFFSWNVIIDSGNGLVPLLLQAITWSSEEKELDFIELSGRNWWHEYVPMNGASVGSDDDLSPICHQADLLETVVTHYVFTFYRSLSKKFRLKLLSA